MYTDEMLHKFYNAYWASKPPEVAALRDMPVGLERVARAFELAAQGYVIDPEIDTYNKHPLFTMDMREHNGYTWYWCLGQKAVPVVPGAWLPGFESYDPDRPPTPYIKVSSNIDDYPPYDTPGPVVAPPPAVVGRQYPGTDRYENLDTVLPIGAEVTTPQGTFRKYGTKTPFGLTGVYWKRV
jgi:hypothetical protein